MNRRASWLLLPAFGGALLLNLLLLAGAALLAADKPFVPPALNPVPVNLVTLEPRSRPPETKPLPPPPVAPQQPPQIDFTPELVSPRLRQPTLDAVKVKLDPSLWKGEPQLGHFVFAQGDLDEPPRALVRTTPVYPYKARQRGIEGFVEVKLLVQADGTVASVEILAAQPKGVFDSAALKAVPHWKFSPGKIEGRNVPSWVVTRVVFSFD